MNVYVIAVDAGCEFGPPLAVRSSREEAIAYAKRLMAEDPRRIGLFVFPFIVDAEHAPAERGVLVHRTETFDL